MALEGSLREFSLADIFQLIGLQRKTGVLTLTGEDDTVSISFESGAIVAAESEAKRLEDRLGSVLLKTGKVSRGQLNRILQQQRETGRRIGDLLVSGELLEPPDLERALALQVSQVIYRLFRWSRGTFRFAQTSAVDFDRECFRPIPVENVLMEGMRILDEWPLIERRVRSFDVVYEASEPGRQVRRLEDEPEDLDQDLDAALGGLAGDGEESGTGPVPGEREDAAAGPEVVALPDAEWRAYGLLDGSRTVQDVIDRSDLGEFETCKALFGLLEKELIQEVGAAARPHAGPNLRRRAVLDRLLATLVAVAGSALLLGGVAWQAAAPDRLERALAPYRATSRAAATLRLAASQSRLARLDFAVRLYALSRRTYPARLEQLADMGLLSERDLTDPWGRRYRYILTRRSYQIRGSDGAGQERPELVLTGRIPLEPGAGPAVAAGDGGLPDAPPRSLID